MKLNAKGMELQERGNSLWSKAIALDWNKYVAAWKEENAE